MPRSFIALGGNLGETQSLFSQALDFIDSLPGFRLAQRSSLFRSTPMGSAAGKSYINAVAEFECALTPESQLTRLHQVEEQFGRVRSVVWGPRPLDLDLLYCDEQQIDSESIKLPHPHARYRRFVLEPMCEIAADFQHPRWKQTQRQLLTNIDLRPLRVHCWRTPSLTDDDLAALAGDFPDVRFEAVDSLESAAGSLWVTSDSANAGMAETPLIDLTTLPGQPADALRSVLEATLGSCERLI